MEPVQGGTRGCRRNAEPCGKSISGGKQALLGEVKSTIDTRLLASKGSEKSCSRFLDPGVPKWFPTIVRQHWLCLESASGNAAPGIQQGGELGFYLTLGERLTLPLNHTSLRIFRLSGLPPGWLSRAATCMALIPPCAPQVCNCCLLICIQISQEAGRWSGNPMSFRIFHSLLSSTSRSLWHSQ